MGEANTAGNRLENAQGAESGSSKRRLYVFNVLTGCFGEKNTW